ncbi:MAG: hypothetical protein IID16_08085 [Candidatus Marinimicrobia bacterium]|nr:hypothetical protein [Candidatus Neomarinimicrobiota bacterium]
MTKLFKNTTMLGNALFIGITEGMCITEATKTGYLKYSQGLENKAKIKFCF